ncbi:MAG: pyridoxamine 5'-phosphate oxidase family protein [Nocardioides sp.]
MSIPVDVTRLAEALTDFGSGYLLTVSPAGRVKAFTVDPVVRDGLVVVAAASRGTAANLAANDAVTLVLPPRERHGYTLLVDGTGRALGDEVEITPEAAVLHRPAAHGDGPLPPPSATGEGACGHDCQPV